VSIPAKCKLKSSNKNFKPGTADIKLRFSPNEMACPGKFCHFLSTSQCCQFESGQSPQFALYHRYDTVPSLKIIKTIKIRRRILLQSLFSDDSFQPEISANSTIFVEMAILRQRTLGRRPERIPEFEQQKDQEKSHKNSLSLSSTESPHHPQTKPAKR
jgi:hypothetical protein